MSVTFEYSLKEHFVDGLNVKELHKEIEENEIIISKCLTVKSNNHGNPDIVEVVFEAGLTRGERLTLNQIIESHVPMNMPDLTGLMVKHIDKITIEGTYEKLIKFIFPGAEFCHIKVDGHMDAEAKSWSIMVYDFNNHRKIAEGIFTNTQDEIHDLGLAQLITQEEVTLEIFAKVDGGSEEDDIKAYIDSIEFKYI
jgi:hypothetical protein